MKFSLKLFIIIIVGYFFSACTGYEAFKDPKNSGEFIIGEAEYVDVEPEHVKAESDSVPKTGDSIFVHDGTKLISAKNFLPNQSATTTSNVAAHPNGVIELTVKPIIYACNFSRTEPSKCAGQGKINDVKNKLKKTFNGFKNSLEAGSNGMFKVIFDENNIEVSQRLIAESDYNVSGPPHHWYSLKSETVEKLVAQDFKGKKTVNYAILLQEDLATANFTMFDLGLITMPGASSDGVAIHEFYHYVDFRLASSGEEGMAHADQLDMNSQKQWPYECVTSPETLDKNDRWDWLEQQFAENILSLHQACDGRKIDYCDIKGELGTFVGDKCSQGIMLNPTTFGNQGPTSAPADVDGKWKDMSASSSIPGDAFIAGNHQGQNLFICRASHGGGIHPGRVVDRKCIIPFGGNSHVKTSFEILVGNYDWFSEKAPGNAVPVGHEANGSIIYSCQANVAGGVHPGKSSGGSRCSIAIEGQSVVHSESGTRYLIPAQSNTPPPSNPPPAPPSSEGWVTVTNSQVPANAFIGGTDHGKNQNVCRFSLNGGVHSGRFVNGLCRVGWGGQAHFSENFEVLVGNFKWVSGGQPNNAVIGGQESSGAQLTVCQANHDGGLHPGKFVGGRCAIAYGGKEVNVISLMHLVPTSGGSQPAPPSSNGFQSVTNGQIPSNAFKGGSHQGKDLYVCRANLNGGVHPGRTVDGRCHIGWGGQEHIKTQFEVLVGSFQWKSGSKPNNAVVGGNEASGSTIYVCRAQLDGSKQPGKTGGNNICAIGYEGQEHNQGSAQYLVPSSGGSSPPSTNPGEPCRQIIFGICIP